jgi:hypothetical protein
VDFNSLNKNWVVALVATVNTIVLYRQLSALRRKNDFDILREVDNIVGRRFRDVAASDAFYGLSRRFARVNRELSEGPPETWHAVGIIERLNCVADLSHEEYTTDISILRPVVNAYNDLAQQIELGLVDSSSFLSKYHLMILREGWIVEPYAYYESIERNPGRWGLRVMQLLDAARTYHETNPLHGGEVYLLRSEDRRADVNVGCVWRPAAWSKTLRLRHRLLRWFGFRAVSESRKRVQRTLLSSLKASLERWRRLGSHSTALLEAGKTDSRSMS